MRAHHVGDEPVRAGPFLFVTFLVAGTTAVATLLLLLAVFGTR